MTLGEMLYDARKSAGITLPEVARGTNIRLAMLQKLEESDYDTLPSAGYVRGFINSYTRFVGVDPKPFLSQYEKDIGVAATNTLDLVQSTEAVLAKGKQHTIDWHIALKVTIVVALVAFGIWLIYVLFINKPDVPVTPVAPTSSEATTTKTETLNTRPFKLAVTVIDGAATNVIVKIDGSVAFEGVLTGSNKLEYNVVKSANITAASPEKITVTQDGTNVPLPKGEDVTIDLTAPKK